MFRKSKNVYVLFKSTRVKNVNEIEQNFANSKNVHEWKNILKLQQLFVTYKIVYSFIKYSLIQKVIMHFKKGSLNRKNVLEFQKLFHQFPKKYVRRF